MRKLNISLIFLLTICCSISGAMDSTTCDKDKCYRSVNTAQKNLLALIKNFDMTASSAKIPLPVNIVHVKRYIKEVDKIANESLKIMGKQIDYNNTLNQWQIDLTNNHNIAKLMLEKLSNISEISTAGEDLNNTLIEVERKYNKFKELVDFKQNVSQTCKVTKDEFMKFERTVNNVSSNYDTITKNLDDVRSKTTKINKKLNETSEETIKNKNNFEQLQLPDNVLEYYLNETERELNSTLNYLKENADILKQLLEASNKKISDEIVRRSEEVKKIFSEVEDDLGVMNKELSVYEDVFIDDDFNRTVNDESIKLINIIKEEIKNLKNKTKIDFTEEEKELLKKSKLYDTAEVIKNKRKTLINYGFILDAFPFEQLQKAEWEIKNFTLSISLTQQFNKLNKESTHLKKLRDEIVKTNCSEISGLLT